MLRLVTILISLMTSACMISPKPAQIEKLQENVEYDEAIQIKKYVEPGDKATDDSHSAADKTKNGSVDTSKKNKKTKVKSQKKTQKKTQTSSTTSKKKSKKSSTTASKQKSVEIPKGEGQKKNKTEVVGDPAKPKNQSESTSTTQSHRLPKIEDGEGFKGRRPLVDPFRVGEVLSYDVSYGVVSAGQVQLKTHPFVEVNGKKSYYFTTHAQTNSVFSLFYKVRDWAETYVDFEDLTPYNYALHVRESKQWREVRSFFDWKKLKGKYWEKRIKNGKMREKKKEWVIKPFSQNVISSFFYIRTFTLKKGKELQFRVADDGKNLVTKMKVVGKEKLKTAAGKFDTHKVELNFTYEGVFKPVGKVFVWLTDDERKIITRIDAKIKIGTVTLELEKIE